MANFLKNPIFTVFNLAYLFRQKNPVADKVWADVMELFRQSLNGLTPLQVLSMHIEKALRTMQTGQHIGKLVTVAKPDVTVKVCLEWEVISQHR